VHLAEAQGEICLDQGTWRYDVQSGEHISAGSC
jgi:hypothetical protein